jgi:hypothetical protein
MFVGLGDVDEHAGQELERIDELGIVGIVSCFGLVDEKRGVEIEAQPRQVDRSSHEITSEPVKALGVLWIDGGLIVNGEAGITPRKEQVDALLGDELAVPKKSQDLVPEEELSAMGIDVGDGMPRAVIEKNPASDDGVDVGIPFERRGKGLYDGNHTGPGIGLVDGSGHHLADGFVGESCELSKELSMEKEVGAEHLWQRENPLGVGDVGEDLFLKQRREDDGSLGAA